MNEKLTAKVEAINKANARFNELAPKIQAALQPFIGKKARTVTGSATAKLGEVVRSFNKTEEKHRVYISVQSFGVYMEITTWVEGAHYPFKQEGSLARISDGVMTEMFTLTPRRTDYTVEEILANREALEKAEELARDMESKLREFGKYD